MTSDTLSGWARAATADPSPSTFGAVSDADAAALSPADLLDLIVVTDRLQSRLAALQMTAMAEFARPGRAGRIERLLDAMAGKAGWAKLADGTADPDALKAVVEEHAAGLAATEIAAALRQSHRTAARRVNAAVEMLDELPDTLDALRAGLIDRRRAEMIAQRTRNLDPENRRKVEALILPLASTRTAQQLRPMIDRRVLRADRDAAVKRARQARKARYVHHSPGLDGMAGIRANFKAEDALTVYDLLDRMARAVAGQDDRPLSVLRADAWTDLCTRLTVDGYVDLRGNFGFDRSAPMAPSDRLREPGASNADQDLEPLSSRVQAAEGQHDATRRPDAVESPARGGKRQRGRVARFHGRLSHYILTMSLDTYLGLSNDPVDLAGHGAMPAEFGRWMRKSLKSLAVMVVDPQGHAIAVGGTVYPPSQAVTDQVLAASAECRFPACRTRSELCDLDHRVPFDHEKPDRGGRTVPWNLDPACEHHHLLKTFTDWSGDRDRRDRLTMNWTSPTGHHYVDHPTEHALPEDPSARRKHSDPTAASFDEEGRTDHRARGLPPPWQHQPLRRARGWRDRSPVS
ncbi:protein of unknown function [Nakamurella panacisegetis]|uniref:DUF222 domain-containing protein n=2 Tax=Nakamurella panacisegetis TaxID=1090615 RepID=A0A1H0QHD4_9ACTN|nr:protein of unknown function [Nakamurella panacisegetis]